MVADNHRLSAAQSDALRESDDTTNHISVGDAEWRFRHLLFGLIMAYLTGVATAVAVAQAFLL